MNAETPVPRDVLTDRVLGFIALVAVVYLLVLLGTYAVYDGYLDHGEAIVAAGAHNMLNGIQVYPAFESGQFTSNVYGPFLYLFNGAALLLFGGNATASKLAGLAACLGAVAILGFAFRRRGAAPVAFAVLAMAAFVFVYTPYAIWNRPDPFLVFIMALGVFLTRARGLQLRPLLLALALGAAGGIACSLKIYAPLYFVPVGLYVAIRTRNFITLPVMAVTGIAVAAVPFTLSVFDAGNYLAWFELVAGKRTVGGMVTHALKYAPFFLIPPFVLLLRGILRERRSEADGGTDTAEIVYAAATFLITAALIYLGSKPGAGGYYLLPVAPLAIDMMIRASRGAKTQSAFAGRAAGIFALLVAVLMIISVPVQKRYFRALHWDRAAAIAVDFKAIDAKYPGLAIQTGLGDSINGYNNMFQKSELVFAGNPYTVDFGVMIETSYLGIPLPDAVIEDLDRCVTDIWLIPRGENPFTMIGYYGNTVLPEAFRQAFHRHYTRIDTSAFFDIWRCKAENG